MLSSCSDGSSISSNTDNYGCGGEASGEARGGGGGDLTATSVSFATCCKGDWQLQLWTSMIVVVVVLICSDVFLAPCY